MESTTSLIVLQRMYPEHLIFLYLKSTYFSTISIRWDHKFVCLYKNENRQNRTSIGYENCIDEEKVATLPNG